MISRSVTNSAQRVERTERSLVNSDSGNPALGHSPDRMPSGSRDGAHTGGLLRLGRMYGSFGVELDLVTRHAP